MHLATPGAASPPRSASSRAAADSQQIVEVTVRWAGRVRDVRRVGPGGTLAVGRGAASDVILPLSADTALAVDHAGLAVVRSCVGATTTVSRLCNEPIVVPAGASLALDASSVVVVRCGAHELSVRWAPRAPAVPLPVAFDALWANAALGVASLAIVVLAAALLAPPDLQDLDVGLQIQPTRYHALLLSRAPPENAFLKKLAPTASGSPKRAAKAPPAKAPPFPPAARAKRAEQPADGAVVDAKLRALFGSGASGLASVLADADGELSAALAGLDAGAKVAGATGALALRGGPAGDGGLAVGSLVGGPITTRGRGGGGGVADATGGLTTREDRDPTVVQGPTHVSGGLDAELVRRVVKAHEGQVRYCYEQALVSQPGLAGKVAMRWVIGGDGHVTHATAVDDQLQGSSVGACLTSRVKTWRFPSPKGGGIVVVTYPFVFKR